MEKDIEAISILGTKLNIIQIPGVIDIMERWIKEVETGNYIVIANANDVMMGRKYQAVNQSINESSLSVADGISLVWAARVQGRHLERRVYGPDLMLEFLKTSCHKEYSHFFYGSDPDTLKTMVDKIKTKFPQIKISGFYSPPFRKLTDSEDEAVAKMINQSCPDVLWVGLGCPRQQLWMHEHRDKLKVPVMAGVGAAFDFIAGTKLQAPQWMRNNGFEWLFRLVTEPKRLWKRYLVGNFIFLWLYLKELVKIKFLKFSQQFKP
ncbi:MAG: WecB/TagA/CpsF family glycosyltransferase [Candidatus Omnitrophica bacterium]|nr:WecB/TagA/CpsF family glycosyltransferase [Candidatus Omnitrophota bacterium]